DAAGLQSGGGGAASILGSAAASAAAGAALGVGYAGLLRRAQGRALVLSLLVSLPLAAWGLARQLGLPPAAAVLAAAVVLANDRARRDLVMTLAAELERPAALLLPALAGASILPQAMAVWGPAAAVALTLAAAGPLAWRLSPPACRAGPWLPLSPLAAALALLPLGWPSVGARPALAAAAAIAAALAISDLAARLPRASRRAEDEGPAAAPRQHPGRARPS
ncbi:MAG TPA: hypothetical protein VJV23_16355, partial [Candidatus Polarisedimenticolia bacterium]|nr:hypothetical protein [Candidatus Polarisedimenticolia bacterium]